MKNTFTEFSVNRLSFKWNLIRALIMRISRVYILLLITGIMATAKPGNGQSIETTMVKLEIKNEPLLNLFSEIETQTDFRFSYAPGKVKKTKKVSLAYGEYTIKQVLELVLPANGLSYRVRQKNIVVFPNSHVESSSTSNQSIQEQAQDTEPKTQSKSTLVHGKVTDGTDQPLTGVNVLVRGTTRGTTTDANGQYNIDVDEGEILVFSFIGFKTKLVTIAQQTIIDVRLEAEVTSLKEVTINAGYYDVKDKEKTGNISKVSTEVINKQPVTNPLGALQGRMPGVFIQQTSGIPGSDFKIEIRGRNSLRNDGNEPLYIVDGVPFSSEKVSAYYNASGILGIGASPLTSINPADIESIEVLKDAAATAIYGSRGANGVVLITTKKGKAGRTQFDINFFRGVGFAPRVKLLNTTQYLAMRKEAFSNDGISVYPANAYDINGTWDTTRYTDWQKELIGGALTTTNLQGSVSGGSEHTQFLLSAGYRKDGTTFLGDFGFRKGSAHLSINHQSFDKKLSIAVNVSGTIDKNNQMSYDYTFRSRVLAPNAPPLYTETGELNWENSTWSNPLNELKRTYEGRVNNLIGNAVFAYKIINGLQIKTSFGLNSISSNEFNAYPSTYFDPAMGRTSAQSSVTYSTGSNQSWIIEPQITWDKKIAKGQLSALVGATVQERQFQKFSNQYYGFPSNSLLHNLSSAARVFPYEFTKHLYRYAAFFGRVNYNWEGKYILDFTARRDGSSRFGPGKQFANFGALGAAWVFSNEGFFKEHSAILSFGKLRASYGSTGNDQIGNYQFLDTYSTPSGINQYQGITVLNPTRLYNPDFAWETNKKLEGAIELGFWEDRLLLNVSYYRNRSSNQLVNYTLPMTTGFTGILANLKATVQNTGIEAELTTINLKKDVEWTTSFNVTVPRNTLVEFPNIESSSYANTYVVGKPIYIQKYLKSTGVDPQTGLWTFKDFNEDGTISTTDDRKEVVFVGQDFYGGFNNSVTWKGWSLDIFLQFVKQTGFSCWFQNPTPGILSNQLAIILEGTRWQKPGDKAVIQRFATETNAAALNANLLYTQHSDAVVSDASFIRLKNVSLSYKLPERWIKNRTARLYFQGQNLFVMTNYKGYDPESQYIRVAPLRMFTGGIQITL